MIANPQNIDNPNLFVRLGLPANGTEDGKEISVERIKEAFEVNRTHWKTRAKKVRTNKEKLQICEDAIKKLEQTYELLKTKEGIHNYRKMLEAQGFSESPNTSQQKQQSDEEKPQIVVSPSLVNFETVNLKQSKTTVVNVTNKKQGELIWEISKYPQWLKIEIHDNQIKVTFVAEQEGSFDEDIVIESNGGYARIPVTVKAVVKPVLNLSQNYINYGRVDIYKDSSQQNPIKITNIGSGKLDFNIEKKPVWLKIKLSENSLTPILDYEKLLSLFKIHLEKEREIINENENYKIIENLILDDDIIISSNGGEKKINISLIVYTERLNFLVKAFESLFTIISFIVFVGLIILLVIYWKGSFISGLGTFFAIYISYAVVLFGLNLLLFYLKFGDLKGINL